MLNIKWKNTLGNLTIFFIIVVICLALLELVSTKFVTKKKHIILDPYTVYKIKHGTKYRMVMEDGSSHTVVFNSKGLMDYEYPYEKQDCIRILVIGDSFVEGEFLPLEDLFTKILERKLNSISDKKFEVIGAGVSSWDTENQLNYLKHEGYKYKPDIVIISVFLNDVWDNYRRHIYDVEDGKLIENTPVKTGLIKKLSIICASNSYFCTYAYKKFLTFKRLNMEIENQDIEFTYWGIPEELFSNNASLKIEKGFEETGLLLAEFKKFSSENDITPIILSIPLREQVDSDKFNRLKETYDILDANVSKFQSRVKSFAEKDNIYLIDPLDAMRETNVNNTYYFEIDPHWNKNGNVFVADYIYEKITKDGLI